MRYVSFFSGVEMATLAWKQLGWELVAVAEVDPFACAVLAHHHPDVPNLGDISKVTDDQIRALGKIDIVIGGFPCQDVSNAGKRKGLRNADGTTTRSGLFFDAMRLVRVANPRWLVIENVPGLYSSPPHDPGRDFAAVVGEIVGSTFDVPREGWQDTGAAAGPRGMVEWCCLDAQWRGLAQRRERVFFVADFGAWTNRPPVLLERESLSRNPPACVAARARSAAGASRRARRKSIWEQIGAAFRGGVQARPAAIAGALGAADGKAGADATDAEGGRLIPSVSGTLGGTSPGGGWRFGADEAAAGQLIPSIAGTLDANGKAAGSATQQDAENDMLVVTPILEPTKRAGKKGNRKDGSGHGMPGDPMFTLQAGAQHGVALAYGGNDTSGPRDVAACLNAKGGALRMDFESETLIAHTLRGDGFDASEDGTGRGTPIIPLRASGAHGANGLGIGKAGDPMLTLDTDGSAAIAFSCKDDGRDATADLAPTMRSMNFDKSHANAGGQLAIAFNARQDPVSSGDACLPLDTDGQFHRHCLRHDPDHEQGEPLAAQGHPPAYATLYEVRRLTPKECARLQGVPDDYLDIEYRGREAADGPKYKALGNGFPVPVILWIGQRIEASLSASRR